MELMKCEECIVGVYIDHQDISGDVVIRETDYLRGQMVLLGFNPFRTCPVCGCPIDWRSLDMGLEMDVTIYAKKDCEHVNSRGAKA